MTPPWSETLSLVSGDHFLGGVELGEAAEFPNTPTGNNALYEQPLGEVAGINQLINNIDQNIPDPSDLNFDLYPVPNLSTPIQDVPDATTTTPEQTSLPSCPRATAQVSSPAQLAHANEMLKAFDHAGLEDSFPHVSALGRIIKLLEGHIQKRNTAIDEIMRVNKTCVTEITEIMNSEAFKPCNSCRMLIMTAMDLVMMLYETGVSEVVTAVSRSARPDKCIPAQKASLQFGVFQVEPEDYVKFRNQVIQNELERYIQAIQSQGAEFRSYSTSGPLASNKLHQQWFHLIENRARALASSLNPVEIPM